MYPRGAFVWLICVFAASCSSRDDRASRLTGVVEAAQTVVSSPADGVLAEMRVRVGERVEKGAVLAVIEALPLQARLQQLRTASKAAARELDSARARRERMQAEVDDMQQRPLGVERRVVGGRLVEQPSDTNLLRFDLARDRLLAAEALEQSAARARSEAEAALQAALLLAPGLAEPADESSRLEVRAPAEGVAAAVTGPAGRAIRAGQPVATLYGGEPWVRVALEESLVSAFSEGDSLAVELADGRELTGTIASIAPAPAFATQRDVDRRRRDIRAFEVEVRLPATEGLRPGMTAYVRVSPR